MSSIFGSGSVKCYIYWYIFKLSSYLVNGCFWVFAILVNEVQILIFADIVPINFPLDDIDNVYCLL